jgi:phage major head subunit gpT-like protein
MDTNRTNMQEFFNSLLARFKAGMEAVRSPQAGMVALDDIAMAAPVSGSAVIHGWLAQIPGMREWLGDRLVNNIKSGKLNVVNRDFESTISVPRNDIEDDNYGLYGNLAQSMGAAAEELWLDLVIDALIANGNWADAAAFFGTTRTYGANTISNYVTSALATATFNTAVTTMMSYKGDGNRPLKVVPRVLLVGPKLRTTAFEICKAQNFVSIVKNVAAAENVAAAAVQNPNAGLVEPKVSPKLIGTYDDYWYLLGEVNGIKAGFVQKRKEPAFVSLDRDTDENVFMRKEFLYGTDARGEGFLTLPHLAYAGVL